MMHTLPVRLSADGLTATWNPAVTRASHVTVEVRGVDGQLAQRRTLNSGRVRVREPERIERVLASE